MATEAFVCPHCRTWVEGSGRTIRCSACGRRFQADEARLNRRRQPATFDAPDYEVPHQSGWDLPDDDRYPATETAEPASARWREPEVPTFITEAPPDYETPADARLEPSSSRPDPLATPEPPGQTPDARPESKDEDETPWSWIFGAGILLLFLVGGRFLSGELFALAFVALIAAQWILGRKSEKK